ncbi:winged helix-turn-helix domain-containing protein [Lysobacter solisilvae (ex Woo and Kim 2020)]|uniref:Tetratricopeptide repeat protein n=1 Tax=Agrilutibacter terrestris TaxID=2865112 RepID=A0A7H0FW31_9GAMM|nr:winged helix-turn-helix domain-containing protein [Lysobacter terrestris]QNP40247.1 tetratricopeptide repeat protein [Lysobacter terrestris]
MGKNGGDGYRFGPFLVDAAAYTLTRDGEPQSLEPKAFAVLLHLLRHAGELVRHEDLLDAVWGHRHVTPGVLTRAIAQLRHVLEDDSHRPQYIQTQHGLGYRFIGELKSWPESDGPPARALVAPAAEPVPGGPSGAPATGDTHHEWGNGANAVVAASPANPKATRRRRGWLLPVLGAAVLVAAVFGGWQWYRASHPVQPAEPSIAILPFASLSANKDDSYFAEGLAVELHGALAGVPGLKVAACRSDSACGTPGADPRRVGKLLGVASVLEADVRREGSKVRINARLTDTRTGYTLWSGTYDRELTAVFALQTELARDVVQSLLGVLPRDTQALTRRLAPTSNVAAYDAYLHGMQQLGQREGGDGGGGGGGSARSIGFFREALAADPAFSRAQAGICRAEIIAFEGAHDAAAFERAQAACQRAATMDPYLREVSLALGDLYRARSDNAQAIEYYRKALDALALRADAYLGLARTESAQGHHELALDYFERARQSRPGDPTIYRGLGFEYYLHGDMPKAIDGFTTAATLAPDDEDIWSSLGGLYMVSGDAPRAADAYSRSLTIKPNYAALSNLGTLRYEQRRYPEAAELYRRASSLNDSDYRIFGNLGDALAAEPASAAQARESYERAARMAQQYVDIKPSDAHALAVLAWYRANLGQEPESRALIERANALNAEPGEVAFWAAQSLAVLGDADGARGWIERARAGGVNTPRLQASPVLRPLLGATPQPQPAAKPAR